MNPYYRSASMEAWDIIDEYCLNFNLGNALKYILRCGRKGTKEDAIEDLKKAVTYIERECETRKRKIEKDKQLIGDLTSLASKENYQ